MKLRTMAVALAVLVAVCLSGCAWEVKASSDPAAAQALGETIQDAGVAVGGPMGWVLAAVGTVIAGAGAKVVHKLGTETGRHVGYDEAKGATTPGAPATPGG